MNCHIDIKHEEDPLLLIGIKTESQDVKSEVKIEAEEYEDIDIKYETFPVIDQVASIKSVSEAPDSKMNCYSDIKREEGPLLIIGIKTEPQDMKSEVKVEAEECEDVDIKYESLQVINQVSCIKSESEVEGIQENLTKVLQDFQKESQTTQVTDTNLITIECEPCKSTVVQSVEEKYGVCVNNHTEENSKSSEKFQVLAHSNEILFKCNICSKSFSVISNLSEHLSNHRNEKSFRCNVCNKSFSRKPYLDVHSRMHSNEKPFKCNLCEKSYLRKCSLDRHLYIHSDEKPFKCNFCDKSYCDKTSFNKHLYIHANGNPFRCDFCNKSFSQKGHFIVHLSLHSNEKPFKCNVCNKAYSAKSSLVKHLYTHSDEKPFKCDSCNKSFVVQSNLNDHRLSHNKPYKCDLCNRSFSRKCHVAEHLSLVH